MAAWISAANGRYCSFRSSSGTCTVGLVCDEVTATGQLRLRKFEWAAILAALVAVVVAEPVDEFPDPHLDGRRGAIAHVAHQIANVGEGLGHVPGLQRQQFLYRLAP